MINIITYLLPIFRLKNTLFVLRAYFMDTHSTHAQMLNFNKFRRSMIEEGILKKKYFYASDP